MKIFLIYQAEVAICLGAFYVFYKLLLSKDVSHQFKRGYIILTSIIAYIIPALTFNISLASSRTNVPINYFLQISEQVGSIAVSKAPPINVISTWEIGIWMWIIGFTVMLIRLLISLYTVNKVLNKAIVVPNFPYKLSNTESHSFSFFRSIVLNISHYNSPVLKYILAHEQTHANQFHTADILFIETIKLLQWFNPFAWLLAKETALNLEYIADDHVISQYDDAGAYQLAIVQLSQPTSGKILRTEFSKSNLKNRIAMMNQPNTTKRISWRYLLVIPVIMLLLTSFSLKFENLDIEKEISEILPLAAVVSDKILAKIPVTENFTTKNKEDNSQNNSNKKKIKLSINYPVAPAKNDMAPPEAFTDIKSIETVPDITTLKTLTSMVQQDTSRLIKGRVTSQDGSPVPGVNIIIRGTSIGAVTDMEGEFAILVGNSYRELVIASPDNHVEVIDISEGDDFIVTLKSDQKDNILPLDRSSSLIQINSVLSDTGDNVPIYILDKEHVSSDILRTIDPKNIHAITILKGEGATKLYGDKAINGVVIIELKKKSEKKKKE